MPECYIRGSTIKYLRIPDEIIDMVKEEVMSKGRGRGGMQQQKQMKGRGGGGGAGGGGAGRGMFSLYISKDYIFIPQILFSLFLHQYHACRRYCWSPEE